MLAYVNCPLTDTCFLTIKNLLEKDSVKPCNENSQLKANLEAVDDCTLTLHIIVK
jgi:hypothetical protein